jgi:methionyl-tRNA formyltransferase
VTLRVVFAGTPEFAVPCLQALVDANVEVVGVYTQPDRPAGRGRKLTPSAVKQAAMKLGLAVHQPQSLKTLDEQSALADLRPDFMVVVAYGLILPKKILAIPKLGCWNVHASLLPRWRGAAPIARAIQAGDSQTGVCLMQMEAGLDTGPVMLQATMPITDSMTGGELHDQLASLGARVLREGIARVQNQQAMPAKIQATDGVCYAHKLSKDESILDFSKPAIELERQVRAFNPWPLAETSIGDIRLQILQAQALPLSATDAPGTLVVANDDALIFACTPGALRITQIKPEGKNVMRVRDFLNARAHLRRG